MDAHKHRLGDGHWKFFETVAQLLKGYPFLLIAIAGLSLLFVALFFDVEKSKELKWLLYGAVIAPIVVQFYMETRRLNSRNPSPPLPVAGAPPLAAPLATSKKAIASIALVVLVFLGFADASEVELMDGETSLGLLVVSALTFALAWAARRDIRRHKADGGKLAMTGLVLAGLLMVSSAGWWLY